MERTKDEVQKGKDCLERDTRAELEFHLSCKTAKLGIPKGRRQDLVVKWNLV